MDDKRYNLRSGRQQVPIKLQLAGDAEFLSQMTGSSNIRQVIFSDNQLSSSDSDIDVDELVHHSDQNFSPPHISVRSSKHARSAEQGKVSYMSDLVN